MARFTRLISFIGVQSLAVLGCSAADDSLSGTMGSTQAALLGQDSFLYLRCNATGWDPTPVTRLVPGAAAGTFTLSYEVTQPWMLTGFDHCTFTETNQLDGWGTWQGYYGADAPDPISVPGGGRIRKEGLPHYFNIRYPELGTYTITVSWPDGGFAIRPTSAQPAECGNGRLETGELCDDGNHVDGDGCTADCRLEDCEPAGSYLCMPPAAASTIDELITQCPSAAVLDAIDTDFDIRFEFFDSDGDGSPDDPAPQGNALRCTAAAGSRDLTRSQERLYQALIALRALELRQPLPFTDQNGYTWLRDSIDGLRIRSDVDGSFCCTPPPGATGNYLNIQNDANRAFYYTDLWTTQSGLGLFSLVQLLVHEARHVAVPGHSCGSSDLTIGELGAWGAVYHFSRALAFDSDACFLRPALPASPEYPDQSFAADAYLLQARSYSRQVHTTRFCSEPTVPAEPPEPVTACAE